MRNSLRLLFDQNVPAPLARSIPGHEVARAAQMGWGELANGELPAEAERAGFDVLVTADRNLRYQQNLANRGIGLVVLSSNHWPLIRDCLPHVVAEIVRAGRGQYLEVELPRPALTRRPPPDGSR